MTQTPENPNPNAATPAARIASTESRMIRPT
jgi:hypothetical protein